MLKLFHMAAIFGVFGVISALTRYGWTWVTETCYDEFVAERK